MEQIKEVDTSLASMDYMWGVVRQATDISLDVTRGFLHLYKTLHSKAQFARRKQRVGTYSLCPKCSTPWIAGLNRPNLISCPKTTPYIKRLINKEKKKSYLLSKKEKDLLSTFKNKQNTLIIKCFVCNFKTKEFMPLPVVNIPLSEATDHCIQSKLKKKKRSIKEVNAGLKIPFKPLTQTKLEQQKRMIDLSEETAENVLAKRLADSIPKFSEGNSTDSIPSRPGSRPNSRPGSRPSSRPNSPSAIEKIQRQKKIKDIKNAILINSTKNTNKKKNSLEDFLSSVL